MLAPGLPRTKEHAGHTIEVLHDIGIAVDEAPVVFAEANELAKVKVACGVRLVADGSKLGYRDWGRLLRLPRRPDGPESRFPAANTFGSLDVGVMVDLLSGSFLCCNYQLG